MIEFSLLGPFSKSQENLERGKGGKTKTKNTKFVIILKYYFLVLNVSHVNILLVLLVFFLLFFLFFPPSLFSFDWPHEFVLVFWYASSCYCYLFRGVLRKLNPEQPAH